MSNLGYHDELEAELMMEEAREPDIDAIEENQVDALEDNLSSLPEPVVIGAFIKWLDKNGFNFWIIEAIRKMILKGEERKNG